MNQARTGESKKAKSGAAPRAAAAYALQQVLQHQRSLNQALPEAVAKFKLDASDKGLAQAVAFGVLRELPSLEWYVSQLLDKPLKSKVRIVHYLMLVGLYQLSAMRTASHAAVSASVEATVLVRQKALKGLVNAVLRGFQRQQHNLETQLAQQADKRYNHPGWLLKHLQTGYPEHWQSIVEANQHQPPMWLRVNQRYLNQQRMQLSDYQAQLSALGIESEAAVGLPQALRLKQACDVTALPGFADGAVSVQDAAAQYAAQLVPAQSGQRVLDACAAPGGKTAHLLELYDIEVDALDIEQTRLARVSENLARLHLSARIIHADASTQDWWDGALYDHILLDAPCSATGVIRRHPDIKWLRQAADIANLVTLQQQIFSNMWQLLKPGGTLIYATCSVLPHENALQVVAFLEQHTDAELIPCEGPDMAHIVAPELGAGTANTPTAMPPNTQIGLQWLPQIDGHDGFYYAVLRKAVN